MSVAATMLDPANAPEALKQLPFGWFAIRHRPNGGIVFLDPVTLSPVDPERSIGGTFPQAEAHYRAGRVHGVTFAMEPAYVSPDGSEMIFAAAGRVFRLTEVPCP